MFPLPPLENGAHSLTPELHRNPMEGASPGHPPSFLCLYFIFWGEIHKQGPRLIPTALPPLSGRAQPHDRHLPPPLYVPATARLRV